MDDHLENCLENEARACIQETAEVPEYFEFVSADVEDLMCSEEVTDNAILTQVNGACAPENEPMKDGDDKDTVGQKVSAVDADKQSKSPSKVLRATGSALLPELGKKANTICSH